MKPGRPKEKFEVFNITKKQFNITGDPKRNLRFFLK